VPVEVARQVWQRDDYQCTFTDAQGRRCSSPAFPHARAPSAFRAGWSADRGQSLFALCLT
jgi:hypothetical protein